MFLAAYDLEKGTPLTISYLDNGMLHMRDEEEFVEGTALFIEQSGAAGSLCGQTPMTPINRLRKEGQSFMMRIDFGATVNGVPNKSARRYTIHRPEKSSAVTRTERQRHR